MTTTTPPRPTLHPTRLRQLALVHPDLPTAQNLLTSIFGVPVIFTDPAVEQWGLKNFLISLGGDIIEVVAPFKPNTTAGRLLERRGEGGYMVIMQTRDAEARRREIVHGEGEEGGGKGKGKVIFSHPFEHAYESWAGGADSGWCVQYHPKGMKGGMMPELDSHAVCERNKDPLGSRFSPWHACGKEYERYAKVMEETGELHLLGCTLRLGAGDGDCEGAARQWSEMFGVPLSRGQLAFTNASMGFVKGEEGRSEGLSEIAVGVESKDRLNGILNRAREAGLWRAADGSFLMLGVMWKVTLLGDHPKAKL